MVEKEVCSDGAASAMVCARMHLLPAECAKEILSWYFGLHAGVAGWITRLNFMRASLVRILLVSLTFGRVFKVISVGHTTHFRAPSEDTIIS